MTTPNLPQRLVDFATGEFGDRGRLWLGELPAILERCRAKWGLTLGPPVEEIKVNYVGYANLPGGDEVMLKVGVPHPDFSTEMEALAIYEGRGINRLIDCDTELNAMLLERLRPGTMLVERTDESASTQAAAQIVRNLHETPPPAGHTLPHIRDWIEDALGDARGCNDAERARVYLEQFPRVQAIIDRLSRPDEPQLLLHGDLHHWNILLDESRGWMAIDPKGVIGASCLDVGRFVGNIVDADGSPKHMRTQVLDAARTFSDVLGESQERMLAAVLCDMVMGHSWGLAHEPDEDEPRARQMLAVMAEVSDDVDISRL
jgi:streptomycin 6-kinase